MLSLCLVEDNMKLGKLLHASLCDAGYVCDWYTAAEDFSFDMLDTYHIFLIDVMLPGEDGFSFAEKLRERARVGIIFLTAKGSLQDKKEWFGVGADDYIVKPFVTQELILRIESLAMRISDTHYYTYEDIIIDREAREAKKSGEVVHLTPIEWEVVGYLLRNIGLACNRTDIIEYVWSTDDIFSMSRSLDVAIATIRKKLDKRMIETITNVGYKIPQHS